MAQEWVQYLSVRGLLKHPQCPQCSHPLCIARQSSDCQMEFSLHKPGKPCLEALCSFSANLMDASDALQVLLKTVGILQHLDVVGATPSLSPPLLIRFPTALEEFGKLLYELCKPVP